MAGGKICANVAVAGGQKREYHVTIDPQKLSARGVSVQQVSDAVKASNIIASPGLIDENHHLELALVSGQAKNPEELNSIVVANINGAPVTIADVATVGGGAEPNYTIITADGRPAVLVNVFRQPEANTVFIADAVKAELEAIRAGLPKDITIAPFYDQSLLVRESMKSVRESIIIGLLLSIFILFVFLRNWGTTLVAAVVIPVTILTTFLAMKLAGLSFDLMTLGGVAAAIGLVIDDAIVVVENIYTHLARGMARREAIESAISEITVPIIGSTITPVVVFLPLAFLEGVTGVFFRSLALTMAVALLTSLVLALAFTPVLAKRFVSFKRRKGEADEPHHTPQTSAEAREAHVRNLRADEAEEEREVGRVLGWILQRYERVLAFALQQRWAVVVLILLVGIGSYVLYSRLGQEFLPEFDEGAFVLDYKTPPGSSLQETDRILQHVESLLKENTDVESYSRRTGIELGLNVTEPNVGDFLVKLKPKRVHSTDQVKDDIRDELKKSEPALETEFIGILSDLIGDLVSSSRISSLT